MKTLRFNHNWNKKLDCHCFTTLRLSSGYNFGETVQVLLGGVNWCLAKVTGKKQFNIEDINAFIAGVDTGYSAEECKQLLRNMYKNKNIDWSKQPVYLYLLQKVG